PQRRRGGRAEGAGPEGLRAQPRRGRGGRRGLSRRHPGRTRALLPAGAGRGDGGRFRSGDWRAHPAGAGQARLRHRHRAGRVQCRRRLCRDGRGRRRRDGQGRGRVGRRSARPDRRSRADGGVERRRPRLRGPAGRGARRGTGAPRAPAARMSLGTPRWWYQRRSGAMRVTRLLLTPLSWIWAAVTAWRIASAKPVDPGAPVICVGNLTMGGTGKTPIVRALMAHITALGVPVHGLSRGYGGRLTGPVEVDVERHTARDVGDEPLLLALEGPVWVSRNRAEGAVEAAISGAAVIVMDDGHQNGSVAKALSLVVVDGE